MILRFSDAQALLHQQLTQLFQIYELTDKLWTLRDSYDSHKLDAAHRTFDKQCIDFDNNFNALLNRVAFYG